MLLNDYDCDPKAVINPEDIYKKIDNFPEIVVSCFSRSIIEKYRTLYNGELIFITENDNNTQPAYKITYKGKEIVLFMMRNGSSSVGNVEELFAYGMKKLIIFGSCGVLDKKLKTSEIIVPTAAIRDEGVSYHYIEPNDEIVICNKNSEILEKVLNEHGYKYYKGKTWTISTMFRETERKVEKRKNVGCIAVEQECASLAAVCQFRKVSFLPFFYITDNLDSDNWERGILGKEFDMTEIEKVMLIALEAAIRI